MAFQAIIANDRQAREATQSIERICEALSSDKTLQSMMEGLPHEVIDGMRRSLVAEKKELDESLEAYHEAKSGHPDRLRKRAGSDPGAVLIVARVARGWSQKDLARNLFLPEQQIQRYEAERYQSISLGNLIRFMRVLGVNLSAQLPSRFVEQWLPSLEMSQTEAKKLLKHARAHGWLSGAEQPDETGLSQLKRNIAEHIGEHGTPSLLRTGLNIDERADDWLLLAWKAQVTRKAIRVIDSIKLRYRPLDVIWLKELVQLSALEDGPLKARELLLDHGIVVIVEPQIEGMNVDGAAFLVDDIPVIGLTIRNDRVDNFWFTLVHEIAHVILHYRTGLAAGFFDSVERKTLDEMEIEANNFAGNLFIPEELWTRSPVRISKSAEVIEKFASQLNISPALVFGRIRKEREQYTIFSNKLGSGKIRRQFLS